MKTYQRTEPWVVPPKCGGQIVEIAYSLAGDAGVILKRTRDRSDGTETIEAFADGDPDSAWEPWDGAPSLGESLGPCKVPGE